MFEQCTATLNQAVLPTVDETVSLNDMCVEGANKLGLNLTKEYLDRFNYELSVIESKNFGWYFRVVADLMQWASQNQLVGPGRGSSAGSLVAYLLGITKVDPIKYKLLFFRFLDPSRSDTPDVDMDFSDRDTAVEYIVNKYGKKRAAKLGTLAKWQDKGTVNEMAKALEIPRFEFNSLLDNIPKYSAGDIRADTALSEALKNTVAGKNFTNKYPESKIIEGIVNTPSHSATHAAGVVISGNDLSNYVAVDERTGSTMCDMKTAGKLGLLKLDLLGLITLTIIQNTLDLAGKPRNFLYSIDMEDKKVFDVLNNDKFLGVFQFEGYTLKSLTKTIEVTEFNDLPILSSLSRPGASVGADSWVRRKKGVKPITYPHPVLEPYLKETLGLLVYQEQIMLIASEVASMPWSMVTKLRKAISKSLGAEVMREYEEPFVSGLMNKGVSLETSNAIWQQILQAGSYGFNKSHAVAYSIISYWTLYLKCYFPYEFAAATLTGASDSEKQLSVLRELAKEGVEYVPVDIELSTDKWRVVAGKLIGPLTNIIGIGPTNVKEIMSARARQEPLKESIIKKLTNPKTKLDKLFPLKEYLSTVNMSQYITGNIISLDSAKPDGTWQEGVYICGIVESINERDENEEKRIADRIARGQQGIKTGFTKFLEIRLKDDDISNFYAKVGPKEYDTLFSLTERCIVDKTVVVIKGTLTPEAPVLLIKNAKIIGEI